MIQRETNAKPPRPERFGIGRMPEMLRRFLALAFLAIVFCALSGRGLVNIFPAPAVSMFPERGNVEQCAPGSARPQSELVVGLKGSESNKDAEDRVCDPTDDGALAFSHWNTRLGVRSWALRKALAVDDPSHLVDGPGLPRGPPA